MSMPTPQMRCVANTLIEEGKKFGSESWQAGTFQIAADALREYAHLRDMWAAIGSSVGSVEDFIALYAAIKGLRP